MVSDEVTGKIYFSGKNFVYMVYTNKVNFRISGTNFVQLFYTKIVILFFENPKRIRQNNYDNNDDSHNHYSCIETIKIFSWLQ